MTISRDEIQYQVLRDAYLIRQEAYVIAIKFLIFYDISKVSHISEYKFFKALTFETILRIFLQEKH